MSNTTTDPLTLDVSADDYAKIAATDQEVPPAGTAAAADKHARTYQTEEAFQTEKAGYDAKIDDGDIWKRLSELDPPFLPTDHNNSTPTTTTTTDTSAADYSAHTAAATDEAAATTTKPKFAKKEWLTVIAAVGELYWAGDYGKVLQICDWCEGNFELERKMEESVVRWRERSGERIAGGEKELQEG